MKTIGLRRLVREPLLVKRWTRAGESVRVTDNGANLWIIQPDAGAVDTAKRTEEIEALLDEVLREPKNRTGLARFVMESRR